MTARCAFVEAAAATTKGKKMAEKEEKLCKTMLVDMWCAFVDTPAMPEM